MATRGCMATGKSPWPRLGLRRSCFSLYADPVCYDSAAETAYAELVALYTWPEKVNHYQVIKNRIKSYYSLSVRLYLFVKFKYESTTIILFVGIRYSNDSNAW